MIHALLVTIGVIVGVAGVIAAANYGRRKWYYKYLHPLEEAYGAEIDLQRGCAQFFVHKTPVLMRPKFDCKQGWPSPPDIELTVAVPSTTPNCLIRPLRFLDSVRRWVGQGLLTGETAFDDVFFVQGGDCGDREQLRQIIDTQAQAALLSLYGGLQQLQVKDGSLRMVAKQHILNVADQGVVLVERFLGLASQGIDFVDDPELSASVRICEDTSCPVCGDNLEGKVVYCRQCQMPHHADCWTYSQGCAIYGCGSRRKNRNARQRRVR